MAILSYLITMSLDGYIEDESGDFQFTAPGEDVHAFINDLERSVGTYLFGRRMYETMAVWDDPTVLEGQSAAMHDFARIWQGIDKVVYSRTLESASIARTRVEREFNIDAVREMKARAERDLSIGGPELAARAIGAGLVDEYALFVAPVVVGGGKRALPQGVRTSLELMEERRFAGGTVYVRYRTRQ